MIQIWFGLIWINLDYIYNPKDQIIKKQIKHKETQNTYLWFCDWLTWLAFGSSFERGWYIYIYVCMYSVVGMNFSLIELNFQDSILERMHSEIQNAFLAKPKNLRT